MKASLSLSRALFLLGLVSSAGVPGVSAASLSDGLILRYSFDATSGNTVPDLSGNGNDGVIVGAQTVNGKVSGALDFAGTSASGNYVVTPHSASLVSPQTTRELTFAAWIRPESIPAEFPVLLSKGGNGFSGGYEFALNWAGDNDVVFTTGGCDVYTWGANGQWINQHLNEWIHLAFTVQSNGLAQFYINGQPTGDATPIGACGPFNFAVNNDLYIGAPDPASHPNRAGFDGQIDELALYNRALSPQEISVLFETGFTQGVREILEYALAALIDLNDAAGGDLKLSQSIAHLESALDSALWVDSNHLVLATGDAVLEASMQTALKLCQSAHGDTTTLEQIVGAIRTLASIAIEDANASGKNTTRALKALAQGDQDQATKGCAHPVQRYRQAWVNAVQ